MCLGGFWDQQYLQGQILLSKHQWFLLYASFHNPELRM